MWVNQVVPFRGTYYQMAAPFKDIVRTNVYPVPSGGGIPVGVHFTPTVNERRGHQMIVGPGEGSQVQRACSFVILLHS